MSAGSANPYDLIRELTERLSEHERGCEGRSARIEERLEAMERVMRRNQQYILVLIGGMASGLGVYLIQSLAA